ncbi:MAG TPA: hypothetical protein VEX35_04980 [Allosphingosinicella sp.]|nr:hypothetical protein [Allosphingosinicella sp.]
MAIRDWFLKLLRETGNAAAALRMVGHANMFYKRRRRDPEFARLWAEAVAQADAQLSGAESAFPGTGRGQLRATVPIQVEELGGYLRPGRKRKQRRPEPVIRRTSNGRAQISFAREGHMTAAIEADFLARLRVSGNFNASARAVGFQPASLHERYRKWPAFARDCDEALQAAAVQLDFALVAHAHFLLRRPGEEGVGTVASNCPHEADAPFDPAMAMRILSFIDARRFGRSVRGRGKGAPERSFDEAVESVLAKIEAIERHEAMKGERGPDEA